MKVWEFSIFSPGNVNVGGAISWPDAFKVDTGLSENENENEKGVSFKIGKINSTKLTTYQSPKRLMLFYKFKLFQIFI